jgi:mRNA interferase RelE/StbE
MVVYNVFIEKAVYKQLKIIPEKDYKKIMAFIAALANNPRPVGCKKLKGRQG